MQSTLVLTTAAEDGRRAAGWLAAELAGTGAGTALAARVEADWPELVARLYPRRRVGQLVLLEIESRPCGGIGLSLCGEASQRRGDPGRAGIDGLRRLRIEG